MLALVVSVDAADVELASDVLWGLGVSAVEERPAGDHVELWTSVGEDAETVAAARGMLRHWPTRVERIDAAIADTWRRHAQPTWICDDLIVRPAWVPVGERALGKARVIAIEPGSTFGLGDHPTTVLTLRALRAVGQPGMTVLDVGCGSGVLAVAACVLGAARATAIDIAAEAVPVTRANAAANDVAARVDVSTTPLHAVGGSFDIVLANILAPTLIEVAGDLRRVLAGHGTLIVSGVLADHHEHVEAALAPLRRVDRVTLDGWAALTFRRGSSPPN